jgi:hypothetical protein
MDAGRSKDETLSDGDAAPSFSFMLKCLLYSRLETGLVSNKDYYDEDVNVYMAHLLQAFINPNYLQRVKPYLSHYDADVFARVGDASDARLKYTVYKTNADFLLISMGIFDNAAAMQPEHRRAHGEDVEWPRPSEEAYVGRGKTYYRFAYSYSQQLPRKSVAMTDVLEKLAVGFDDYLKILAHMRGEYFDLMDRLSHGEVFHLERTVNEAARGDEVREKQDILLDRFNEWNDDRTEEKWAALMETVNELKQLDPGFTFRMPEA